MTRAPRLLLLTPQFPYDPASGAARTMTTVGELVAQAGFSVESIGTTATEGHAATAASEWPEMGMASRDGVFRFRHRSVVHAVLDTARASVCAWERTHAAAYDALVDEALATFRPDLVMTYGGSAPQQARRRRARASGARVVFGLYNMAYSARSFFDDVELVITPSEFLSRHYRDRLALASVAIDTPLWAPDVVADVHTPRSLTMVNPSMEKGLMFFASLAVELGRDRPDIPIDVFPSRVSPAFLVQAAFAADLDLLAHPRLVIHPTTSTPRSIYSGARAVLVPSLIEDAAPRVVAEALVNGVPPVGSDRGGITEMCSSGGFVRPIPRTIDPSSLEPVARAALAPWLEVIAQLFDDDEGWGIASARATEAGRRYLAPATTDRYVECFERLLARPHGGAR